MNSTTAHTAPGILMLDVASGRVVGRCTGPTADGRCPRVTVGEILPCAGCALVPVDAPGAEAYTVSAGMTLCPITVALALAVPPETALLAA